MNKFIFQGILTLLISSPILAAPYPYGEGHAKSENGSLSSFLDIKGAQPESENKHINTDSKALEREAGKINNKSKKSVEETHSESKQTSSESTDSHSQSEKGEHKKESSDKDKSHHEEEAGHSKKSSGGVMESVMGVVTDNPATRFLGAHCSHGHACPAMPSTYLEQIKGLFTGDFVNVLNNQYDGSALHQGEKNAEDIGLVHSGLKSLTGY